MSKKKSGGCLKKIIFILFVLLVLGGVWLYFTSSTDYKDLVPSRENEAEDMVFSDKRINILFVGVDNNADNQGTGRSDALLVVTLDLLNKSANILSIPRDTYVEVPDYGKTKINHAYSQGGVQSTTQCVEELLHIPIDYHAITDFEGFKEIVDILGGVEIDVDKRMYFHTYDGLIDIEKGPQRLNGEKSLQYVRFRHDPLGDITRTERQQKFLAALFTEAMAPENISKLPRLIPKVLDMVDTDLTNGQLVKIAKILKDMDLSTIKTASLPGDFATIKGISYWRPNEEKISVLVEEYFAEPLTEEDAGQDNNQQ